MAGRTPEARENGLAREKKESEEKKRREHCHNSGPPGPGNSVFTFASTFQIGSKFIPP
jgi:hypothetical protein